MHDTSEEMDVDTQRNHSHISRFKRARPLHVEDIVLIGYRCQRMNRIVGARMRHDLH